MQARRAIITGLLGLAMGASLSGHALSQQLLSSSEAAAKARERFSGSVLDIELDDARGNERAGKVYEIRLITPDSAIIRIRIDATTGDFLEAAGDNLIPALKRPDKVR